MSGPGDNNDEASLGLRQWHPRLQALYRYWQSIHPAEGLPGRRQFDPIAVPELLPAIWLVDVVHAPRLRFRYRLTGTRIREATGREMKGLWLDEAHPEIEAEHGGFGRFGRVVRERRPDWRRGAPTLMVAHQDYSEVESLLLPLAGDGSLVDMILCGSVFYRRGGEPA